MSTMNDTLKKEEALFVPGDNTTRIDKPKYTPKTAGDYLGHVTDVRTSVTQFTDKKTGNDFCARIYNFKVHVAPENSRMTYTTTRDGQHHTHDGEAYVGWTVIGDGVFRFLEPEVDDTFVSNASENDRYLRFCQALGISIETTPREVNGKTVDVSVLPALEPHDINGLPVTAVVNRHKEDWINPEGKSMPQWRVKFIKEWRDGVRLTDEIPF